MMVDVWLSLESSWKLIKSLKFESSEVLILIFYYLATINTVDMAKSGIKRFRGNAEFCTI